MTKTVLLFKASVDSKDSTDRFEKAFEDCDCDVHSLSPIAFTFTDSHTLKRKLKNPAAYAGLILTSKRAIQAMENAAFPLPTEWKQMPTYCVGEITAQFAKSMLGIEYPVHFEHSRALAELLLSLPTKSGLQFMYPCSSIRTDIIPKLLKPKGVPLDEVIVYETRQSSTLKKDLSAFLGSFIDFAVFFSPSGADSVFNAAHEIGLDLGSTKFLTLGTTTTEALLQRKIPKERIFEATAPTVSGLIDAFKKAQESQQPAASDSSTKQATS